MLPQSPFEVRPPKVFEIQQKLRTLLCFRTLKGEEEGRNGSGSCTARPFGAQLTKKSSELWRIHAQDFSVGM